MANKAEQHSDAVEHLTWPALEPDHPLAKFSSDLESLIEDAEYDEIYGIHLKSVDTFRQNIILQKFLRANANDVVKAKEQLLKTLRWRKEYQPLSAKREVFAKNRFAGLGYIMMLSGVPGSKNRQDVVTFNIYGSVKDNKHTFEDVEGFLRWRVALMEMSIEKLGLSNGTEPIPDLGEGPDPYQGFQVHDYLHVSFISQDKYAKAAAKRAIDLFGQYYPELLSRKFFVNVPVVMGWVFSAMKLVLSKETVKKFTVLTYGQYLVEELGTGLPKAYGGEDELESSSETVRLQE